ncbi:hypothetical protein FB45DRAFT_326715 [Roridomyces roridus]|uniref:Uncharacterized protein n=1 Tax=Roridomyces roridus TaxID=1738132 RepID=A0AAD7B526_9AGAR|nr:hypothetical protein FB45DRAFT_326715 [Roridomyces roridus]
MPSTTRLSDWIDHENVTVIVIAHLPGQDSGNSLVPVLWGETSPASSLILLPLAKNESDYAPNTITTDYVFFLHADGRPLPRSSTTIGSCTVHSLKARWTSRCVRWAVSKSLIWLRVRKCNV